jgi:hypothetical protein
VIESDHRMEARLVWPSLYLRQKSTTSVGYRT